MKMNESSLHDLVLVSVLQKNASNVISGLFQLYNTLIKSLPKRTDNKQIITIT